MDLGKLTKIKEAPASGWMLAYLRKEVLFEQYVSWEEVRERIGQEELLELHLFDDKKEYRCIASQSKRYPAGVVETVADFENDKRTVYEEEIYLETKYKGPEDKIQLLNQLIYDPDNGMLEVYDYRLVMMRGGRR